VTVRLRGGGRDESGASASRPEPPSAGTYPRRILAGLEVSRMKGYYPYLNTEYARNKTVEQYNNEEKEKVSKQIDAKPVKQEDNSNDRTIK